MRSWLVPYLYRNGKRTHYITVFALCEAHAVTTAHWLLRPLKHSIKPQGIIEQ